MPAKLQAKPPRGFVINDGTRFRLCRSERTEQGPRRIPVADLGPATDCRCCTISGAIRYWYEFLDIAYAECIAEVEAHPHPDFKTRRQWQRAMRRQRRAERRLNVIKPLLDEFAGSSLVVTSDLELLRSRKKPSKITKQR